MTLAEGSAELSIYTLSQTTLEEFERKQAEVSRTEFQSFSEWTLAHLMFCISSRLKHIPLSFCSWQCHRYSVPLRYHLFGRKLRRISCVPHQIFAVESLILFLYSSK